VHRWKARRKNLVNHQGVLAMSVNLDEVMKREKIAIAAIRRTFGTDDGEYGSTLFVSHHLEELEVNYWLQHLGTEKPEPERVLDIIKLRSHWGGDDELETFDFTLPNNVTDYVISVRFDDSGDVEEISMES
jgi:hypothetical protein